MTKEEKLNKSDELIRDAYKLLSTIPENQPVPDEIYNQTQQWNKEALELRYQVEKEDGVYDRFYKHHILPLAQLLSIQVDQIADRENFVEPRYKLVDENGEWPYEFTKFEVINVLETIQKKNLLINQKPEYKKLDEYTVFDDQNLYCVDMLQYLKEEINVASFLQAYNNGHKYVFDIEFIDKIGDENSNLYFELVQDLPYDSHRQFSYGAAKAVERFIEECKKGMHKEPGTMQTILDSYSTDVDLETETRELIFEEIGEQLFDLLDENE
jgi:hypothetical protein